jgi:hypothetical protein
MLKENAKEPNSWPSSSIKKRLDDSLWCHGRSGQLATMPDLIQKKIVM